MMEIAAWCGRAMPMLRPQTGQARRARQPETHAVGALSRGRDMGDAGGHVVTRRTESIDRARRQARNLPAQLFARARHTACPGGGRVNAFGESQRATIGVPQAPVGVDQDAERGGMDGLGLLRPALERQEGWAAEGEERRRAEPVRQPTDHTPRPAVERIGLAVGCLRRIGERPASFRRAGGTRPAPASPVAGAGAEVLGRPDGKRRDRPGPPRRCGSGWSRYPSKPPVVLTCCGDTGRRHRTACR